ncbi:hypothetical protein [Caballeronia sp. LZ034LL]|uniref:hypothetical protein n=1 Tax=Caballeronia sp. LZ034LL TaxID=3038567 RepID=UPI00285D7BA7|nr:hypothetical protein [Caballeronia sp. LZ034LL]MDR5839374.1 hypothetical protein [Caballeronia sp. LZ034LL]
MNRLHFDLAHQKLTDYLLHFCVSRIHGTRNAAVERPRTFGTHAGFVSTEVPEDPSLLHAGDLLLISGHRNPLWRMAWLKRVKLGECGPEYIVQSTQGEGEVTCMHNVSVSFFHRPTLAQHPEWRWTNEQHWFMDRWLEAVMQHRDTRLIAPMMPVFFGDSVCLKARGRFGISDFRPEKTINDFREMTQDSILSCYDELCQQLHTDKVLKATPTEVDL